MTHPDKYAFRIFVCGSKGGSYAADITSFFLAETNDPYNFISMDAGTSLDCIKVAAEQKQMDENAKLLDVDNYNIYQQQQTTMKAQNKVFQTLTKVGYFRKKQLNGFLVTHAHVDHTAGLVISSAEDDFSQKPVLGLKDVMDGITNQFSKPLWPGNFWYNIIPLEPKQFITMKETDKRGKETQHFINSKIKVKPYRLSHAAEMSSVFLICNEAETSCVLFFGDTGPDIVERMVSVKDWINFESKVTLDKDDKKELSKISTLDELKRSELNSKFSWYQWRRMRNIERKHIDVFGTQPLHDVWDDVIDRIKENILNTIFIESSYLNWRPNELLFGHLTPKYLVNQLEYIQKKLGSDAGKLSVVVTHIKPTWNTVDGAGDANDLDSILDTIKKINEELDEEWESKKGNLDVTFIIPKQADMIYVIEGDKAKHVQIKAVQQQLLYDEYHVDHIITDDKFIENTNHRVLSELAVGYVGVLVFVVMFCFVFGLVFGVAFVYIKERRSRRRKEDN